MTTAEFKTDIYQNYVGWYRHFHAFLLTKPAYHEFAAMFGGRAVLDVSDADLLTLEYNAIGFMHYQLNKAGRSRLAKAIADFAGQCKAFVPDLDADNDERLLKLDKDGWAQLADVNNKTVASILSHLKNAPLKPWGSCSKAEYSNVSNLRKKENIALIPEDFLLSCPDVLPLAFSDDVLSIAAHHLEAPPILLGVTAWTSFAPLPGDKKSPFEAQKYHFDLDDYRFVKQFIYLTDVDEHSGPHEYVPGTHDPDVILAARQRCVENNILSSQEFDDWYFRKSRKEDGEVRKFLGIEPVAISGKSGSRLMVNTEGIHKGRVPVSKDRWLLQFLYGVSANVQLDISKYPIAKNPIHSKHDPALIKYCEQFF